MTRWWLDSLDVPARQSGPDEVPCAASIDDLLVIVPSLRDQVRILGQSSDEDARRFEAWFESLPFPLASILRRMHVAGDDPRRRLDYALKFFEALAEFIVILELSAARQDDRLWAPVAGLVDNPGLLLKSSFGTWTLLADRIGKAIRAGKAGRFDLWTTRLGGEERDFVLRLTDRRVARALATARSVRNDLGHGPVVDAPLASAYMERLRPAFEGLLESWADGFSGHPIVVPIGMEMSADATFATSVFMLQGSNPVFAEKTLTLRQPSVNKQLHLVCENSGASLPLLPLVQLGPIPPSEAAGQACYFYSRYRAGTARLLSFHYELQPEIDSKNPAIRELLLSLGVDSRSVQ